MNNVRIAASVLVLVWSISLASAAELGRRPLNQDAGSGRMGHPQATETYQYVMAEGVVGVEVNLLWDAADFDVGPVSADDKVWSPEVGLFYGVSDRCDIRLCVKMMSLNDEGTDLDALRIGIGTKLWATTGSDFIPYLGVLVNYYDLDSDAARGVDGTFGLSGEAGVGYLMTDAFLVRVGISGETFFGDADATDTDGDPIDVSLSSIGFGIGVTYLF